MGIFPDGDRREGVQGSRREGRTASDRGGETVIDFRGDVQTPVRGNVAVFQDGVAGVVGGQLAEGKIAFSQETFLDSRVPEPV